MSMAKFMIVEDEALLAADLGDNLKELGYDVVAMVNSGEKAIEKIEDIDLDLVLMDIQLKGELDGIETAEKILEKKSLAIIYLTAYADDALLKRAKLSEPYGYMVKPIEIRMLHSTIEMALYKYKLEQERNNLLKRLQKAQDEIKVLQSFLPICATCKKVRNDQGYWDEIEKYILDHIDVQISHGICPDCLEKYYRQYSKE